MVSAGTVTGHANDMKQASENYKTQVDGLSGSWQGNSYDNLESRATEFYGKIGQVINGLTAFAEAVSLYEEYQQEKERYSHYQSLYSGATTESQKSEYQSGMSDCEAKMQELKTKINAALEQASSFKMSASTTNTTTDTSSTAVGTSSTTTSDAIKGVTAEGGEFVSEDKRAVYGHITASKDGKTYTVYKQSQIEGWARDCNRAAASSIASAYAKYDGEAVDIAKKSDNGLGYNNKVTNEYFNKFGLQATVDVVNGKYDSKREELVTALKNGNSVMFDLSRPQVRGQSGQKWSGTRHWVSVLDIKKTGNGPEDYAIFVSDSAHNGSVTNHGLGTGWYSINEFNGQQIANFTTVSKI